MEGFYSQCVCEALLEIKNQQDQLEDFPTSCFSSLVAKLIKVDTIPFMLLTESNEPFKLNGFDHDDHSGELSHFYTSFFRIEEISENCCATISLLRPLDIHGYMTTSTCEVERLERTEICAEVDLNCFCAVQCLDVDLMKKIEVEPKW